jgi:hypothetical protein
VHIDAYHYHCCSGYHSIDAGNGNSHALQAMEIYCRLNGSHFPGWDRFMGMCNTAYYDVHWNDGGILTFTGSAPEDYTTSIVGNRTVRFIHEVAAASLVEGGKPFLAVAATRAPHGPQTPAPVRSTPL